jgi:DNA-directed RNA polymerase specialized sigma24 family protein
MYELAEPPPFEARWLQAEPAVRAFLKRFTSSDDAIDEALQQTRIRAWQATTAGRSFDSDRHFVAWCCTVARHRFLDDVRRVGRHVALDGAAAALGSGDLAVVDVEERALGYIDLSAILAAVSDLPVGERASIVRLFEAPDHAASQAERAALARARRRLESVRARLASVLSLGGIPRLRALMSRGNDSHVPMAVAAAAAALVAAGSLSAWSSQRDPGAPRPTSGRPTAEIARREKVPAPTASPVSASVGSSAVVATQQPSYRQNHSPIRPFVVPIPGSQEGVKVEPSDPADPGQRVCFSTMVTTYKCYRTGMDSVDFLVPALPS